MKKVLFEKCGMTTIWRDGVMLPITVLKLPKTTVFQSGDDTLAFVEKKKRMTKPILGILEKHKIESEKGLIYKIGSNFEREDRIVSIHTFKEGDVVDISGVTKGKGFQGVMKLHNFKGGRASHGASLSHRKQGTTGGRHLPGRVWKNKKMAARMGGDNVTQKNLKIISVFEDLLLIKGSIPGNNKSLVAVKLKGGK